MVRKSKAVKARSSKAKAPAHKQHLIHDRFGVRFAHHKHSGRRLHWRNTSYTVLFFLLIFTAAFLACTTLAVHAYNKTGQGSISFSGFSKGPPPEHAAEILSPVTRAIFDHAIIEVAGSCERNLFLELYRNSVLAGGAICKSDGTFKLFMTLVPGKNDLQVKIHDALWQYGPDSRVVSVWYNVPLPPVPILLVYTKPVQDGVMLGNDLTLEYIISGGDSPYAVTISWSDNSVPFVALQQKVGKFQAKHTYEKAGQYPIIITITDERGTQALMQTVVVVHSDKETLPIVRTGCDSSSCVSGGFLSLLDWAWPALVIAGFMTISFWLGEHVNSIHRNLKLRLPTIGTR